MLTKQMAIQFSKRTPDVGMVQEMNCCVCKKKMNVRRNMFGTRSYAATLANAFGRYDEFTCEFANEDWHIHVAMLMDFLSNVPAIWMKKGIQIEIAQTLEKRSIPELGNLL